MTDAEHAGTAHDLKTTFRWTERLIASALVDDQRTFRHVANLLRPFAEAWQPSGPAHNDFYDEQVIVTPSGRFALVDFEETGDAEPMLDEGTLLAHLRWMSKLTHAGEPFELYRLRLREVALDRFSWNEQELALREAYVLLRLSLASEVLAGAA